MELIGTVSWWCSQTIHAAGCELGSPQATRIMDVVTSTRRRAACANEAAQKKLRNDNVRWLMSGGCCAARLLDGLFSDGGFFFRHSEWVR